MNGEFLSFCHRPVHAPLFFHYAPHVAKKHFSGMLLFSIFFRSVLVAALGSRILPERHRDGQRPHHAVI
jgi:hypothetical protein